MPVVSRDVQEVLFLYQRCRDWNVLPCEGGMANQPEELMQIFDVISEESALHKKREQEAQMLEAEQRRIGYHNAR